MHLASYGSSLQLMTFFTLNSGLGIYSNVQGEQRHQTASSHMVTVKTMQALMMTEATPLCLGLT